MSEEGTLEEQLSIKKKEAVAAAEASAAAKQKINTLMSRMELNEKYNRCNFINIIQITQDNLNLLKNFMKLENSIEFLKNYNILEKYYGFVNKEIFSQFFPNNFLVNLNEFDKIKNNIQINNKEIYDILKTCFANNYQEFLSYHPTRREQEMTNFKNEINNALFTTNVDFKSTDFADAKENINNNNELKLFINSLFDNKTIEELNTISNKNSDISNIINSSISAKFMKALNSTMSIISTTTFDDILSLGTESMDCLNLYKPLKCGLNIGSSLLKLSGIKKGGKIKKYTKKNIKKTTKSRRTIKAIKDKKSIKTTKKYKKKNKHK